MTVEGLSAESLAEQVRHWFAGRVPAHWFDGAPEIRLDREEITVVGRLPAPGGAAGPDGAERRFREETREARIEIARDAERAFGRKVSWGVARGAGAVMFTTVSAPVMTRLRQPERRVLDTLVDAGVARSRSDALAWCVRLVGEHEDTWLASLREALRRVEEVRAAGPRA